MSLADPDNVTPFSPEFARRQKELSRLSHKDVTRGEFEELQGQVEKLSKLLLKFAIKQKAGANKLIVPPPGTVF